MYFWPVRIDRRDGAAEKELSPTDRRRVISFLWCPYRVSSIQAHSVFPQGAYEAFPWGAPSPQTAEMPQTQGSPYPPIWFHDGYRTM